MKTSAQLGFLVSLLAMAATSQAEPYTVLHNFNYPTNGQGPQSAMVLSANTLYGTTLYGGGISNPGIVFKVNTDGTGFSILHRSGEGDWQNPNGLILSGDTLYGTTQEGDNGSELDMGTVFSMKTNGDDYVVLKIFSDIDGRFPMAGVVLSEETLYGTTRGGGASGGGTVFRLQTNGSGFALLHEFTRYGSSNIDGTSPDAGLTLQGNTLFGTTKFGGTGGGGVVFRLNTDGSGFAVVHNFTNTDGKWISSPVVVRGDTLFGTTETGGVEGLGTLFKMNTNGDDFAVLHNFSASCYAELPSAALTLDGSTLYGTTALGAKPGWGPGSIFKIHTDGSGFAVLYSDFSHADGCLPQAGPVVSGGMLFGTTSSGGSNSSGTVFSFRLPETQTPPVISSVTQSNGIFSFGWNATSGSRYQVQYKAEVISFEWSDLGDVIDATNSTAAFSESIVTGAQRFYRVKLLPQ